MSLSLPGSSGINAGRTGKMIDLDQAKVLNTSHRGDGRQQIIKVPCEDRFIIIKCYGLKRSWLRALIRQCGATFLVKKSACTAQGRRDTERAVLTLWKREGFDVPEICDTPLLPDKFPYCVVMEWLSGPTLKDFLRDGTVSLAEKKAALSRYARLWGRRHARALALNEPRLLQENPTLAHVFLCGDRLVHIDFEIVFTWKNDLERLVRREIVGVLQSLAKAGGDDFTVLLDTLLDAYPDLSHFRHTAEDLNRYRTVPEVGWSAPLHRFTRWKKRYRKRQYFIEALNNALKRRTAQIPQIESQWVKNEAA